MTLPNSHEYVALRATISHRGTARVYILALGMAVWATLTLAVLALALPPIAALVPLVALAATYESVRALHIGVERIGRYLLVFHDDQWERHAGLFGRPAGSATVDPLFTTLFLIAAILTLLPLLATDPIIQERVAVGTAVAAFATRVLQSRAVAGRQRAIDEKRFRELKSLGVQHP